MVEQIKQFRIPGVRTLLFFDSDVLIKAVRVNGELFGHNNPFVWLDGLILDKVNS